MKPRIIFRADGNAVIGTGHIYRLLALAEILQYNFEITIATSTPDFFSPHIKERGYEVLLLPEFSGYISPFKKIADEEMLFDLADILNGNEIVVLDGYWFGANYQKAVKQTGARLVCIDDLAETYFHADAVISHAPGMSPSLYRSEPYTKFYLGLDYALLRNDFFRPFSPAKKANALFISMGGSDSYKFSAWITEAVIKTGLFDTTHVLTSSLFSQENMQQIEKIATESNSLVVHQNLSSTQLVDVFNNCTSGIVSSSTVLIECYSRGLACAAGYYTRNQMNIYNGFISQRMALGLGDLNNFNPDKLQEILIDLKKADVIQTLKAPLTSWRNLKELFINLC